MGQIGDPTEIIQIPQPAPAEAPLTLPDDWPAEIEPVAPAPPERVPA